MDCPYCMSAATKQQRNKTSLGYGTFRCFACRRTFNERFFHGLQFSGIPLCWLLVRSARSIRPLRALSSVSRSLPMPQGKRTIAMHSSDYLQKGSRTLGGCVAKRKLIC
jgi:transposase-like protein